MYCLPSWACGSQWDSLYTCLLGLNPLTSDVCLSELGWPALKARREYLSISLLYIYMPSLYDINHYIAVEFSDFCSFVLDSTHLLLLQFINPCCYSFLHLYSYLEQAPFPNVLAMTDQDVFHRAVKI